MDKLEVCRWLCEYDERNPDFIPLEEWDDSREPRKNCFCDNCFYGRDKLALEILRLMEGA